jgi:hypothetical protein
MMLSDLVTDSLVDGAESNRLCSKPSIGALSPCTYAVLIAPSLRWRNRVEMLMQPPLCVTLITDSRPPPWRCPSHIPSVIGLWFTAHRGSPARFGRHHVRYTHTNSTSDRICRLRNLSYRRCIRNPTAHLLSFSKGHRMQSASNTQRGWWRIARHPLFLWRGRGLNPDTLPSHALVPVLPSLVHLSVRLASGETEFDRIGSVLNRVSLRSPFHAHPSKQVLGGGQCFSMSIYSGSSWRGGAVPTISPFTLLMNNKFFT